MQKLPTDYNHFRTLITYDNLTVFNGVTAFTSTREGGVSTGANYATLNLGNFSDDKAENIRNNQDILCRQLGISRKCLINAHQRHTANVRIIDQDFLSLSDTEKKERLEGVDALVSDCSDICLTVTTADCVPILLFDPQKQALAAIHSGWRGTVQNILYNTVHTLITTYSSKPNNLYGVIGPHISAEVYAVGSDVREAFETADRRYTSFFSPQPQHPNHFLLNLSGIIQFQISNCGIPAKNIHLSPLCTFSRPDLFFSARRDSVHSGRMLSGILKRSDS